MPRYRWLLLWITVVGLLFGNVWAAETPKQDAFARCRKDLARRLTIPESEIGEVHLVPVQFPDASLGLPRPGEMYAQVVTPGYRAILSAHQSQYLYAIAGGAPRYAGSQASRGLSVAYITDRQGHPDLNGNLVQLSLAGTNPQIILSGVDGYYPQVGGAVIATRRTSRSGFDLLYLGADQKEQARPLSSAFSFADPVLSPDGLQWAALSRARVGVGWELRLGQVGAAEDVQTVPLPAQGKPIRLWWPNKRPLVSIAHTFYQLSDVGTHWSRMETNVAPDAARFMINKSESLLVKQATENVKVAIVWFNGDERMIATIPGMKLEHAALSPDHRFALVTGRIGDETGACTVDLATGEIMQTLSGVRSEVRLLERAQAPWEK